MQICSALLKKYDQKKCEDFFVSSDYMNYKCQIVKDDSIPYLRLETMIALPIIPSSLVAYFAEPTQGDRL